MGSVDSRAKGARGEYTVRDLLREKTGHTFERVPSSGALAYLKGDLFIPGEINRYIIEVKNYMESPLTDKIFTNKSNYLIKWWEKLLEQAEQKAQEPLLFFKYSRSKVFVMSEKQPLETKFLHVSWLDGYIMLAEEWLDKETIEWLVSRQ